MSGLRWHVYESNCIDWLNWLPAEYVDSIVTDPPYGLGFMGKQWDKLPPGEEWAQACLRVLKPGGHLLAFGGTRTYHRLVCALEDAGFEIRDCIYWLYGSGFPKAKKLTGEWEGWSTTLKPACEPIVVARKPLIGTVGANLAAHGTGALNIGATRVPFQNEADERESKDKNRHADFGTAAGGNAVYGDYSMVERKNYDAEGRWPANVVLDEEAAAQLDEQSGETRSRKGKPRSSTESGEGWGLTATGTEYNDFGGASRFFYVAKPTPRERSAGLADKNHHPTVKPIELMRWLVRLVTPPGGRVLDPFTGSGTTGIAAVLEGFSFGGCDADATYVELARTRIAHWQAEAMSQEAAVA